MDSFVRFRIINCLWTVLSLVDGAVYIFFSFLTDGVVRFFFGGGGCKYNSTYLWMVSSVFYCSLTYLRMSRLFWNWFVCGRCRPFFILCQRVVSSVVSLIYGRCHSFSWWFLFALSVEKRMQSYILYILRYRFLS